MSYIKTWSLAISATAVLAVVFLSQPVHAGWTELRRLTASDASSDDHYGHAVALSERTGLIGSPYYDGAGQWSGAAYIVDIATGQERHILTASDAAAEDHFGSSAAIRGNFALVGSPNDDDPVHGSDSGSAYLFNVATGQQLWKLTANDGAAYDVFGGAVAVDGNRALVGALGQDGVYSMAGAAYLFDTTTGQQVAKLTASDAWANDNFGGSLAVDGDLAIIGASAKTGVGKYSGAAYAFDLASGQQLRKFTPTDAAAGDYFGSSVAISGDIALIGAYSDDAPVGSDAGSAYVFDVGTGQQLWKLTPSDPIAGQRFGTSVAISGDLAMVGAPCDNQLGNNAGAAYLFDLTTGEQIAKLVASNGITSTYFGFSVALNEGTAALVGAYLDDRLGFNAGAAYVFTVPEPATAMLLAIGLAAMCLARRHCPRA